MGDLCNKMRKMEWEAPQERWLAKNHPDQASFASWAAGKKEDPA